MNLKMEEGSRQEQHPICIGMENAATNLLVTGNRQLPRFFSRFIWLAPNKDREARVKRLERCAIASIVGALERSPQAVESTLREVYDFEYPWKAIPLGMETYLIEFPSTESLEKATTGQLLFGSKSTLLIKKWEEDTRATETLQKVWIRLRGLPRECWVWDDVNDIVKHFCGLEKIECGDPVTETHNYLRALIICVGPQSLPSVVRVGIETKVYHIYIEPETGESMNPLAMHTEPSNLGNITYGKSEVASEVAALSGYNWREMHMRRGYVVSTDIEEGSGMNKSMSVTNPYLWNNLRNYSMKIGPSRLSANSSGIVIGGHKKIINECQGADVAAQRALTRGAKRRTLELFPEDFWKNNKDSKDAGSKGEDITM